MSGGLVHTGAPAVPVVLENPSFPAAVRVFDDKDVAQWQLHIVSADNLKVADDMTLEIANRVAVEMAAAIKAIDARDVELRAPLKNTMAAIRDVTDRLREPLDRSKRALVTKIAYFDRDRKEAAEKLRQEALAKHAAEVKRLQDETAAKAKAERDRADKEARELAEMMGETYAPPAAAAPAPAPIVTDFAKQVLANHPDVKRPGAVAAPAVAAAATVKRVPKLRINDYSKIPYKIGSEILMTPNEAAIMRVLQAGGVIDGCEIVYEDMVSMKPNAAAERERQTTAIRDPKTGEELF